MNVRVDEASGARTSGGKTPRVANRLPFPNSKPMQETTRAQGARANAVDVETRELRRLGAQSQVIYL